MLLGLIGTISGIAGIYGFYNGILALVVIGGIVNIVEVVIGLTTGELHSLATVIIAAVVGIIYAFNINIPIWLGIAIGLCFESAIMGILGLMFSFAVAAKTKG